MSNHHTLTKQVNHEELIAAMISEGVTAGIAIDHEKVILSGAVWNAMDAAAQTAELAKVATAEAGHTPTTLTEVSLTTAPHPTKFFEECNAVTGVTHVALEHPASYPGTGVLHHNSLSAGEKANLVIAAEAHDPTAVPSLSVDGVDPRVWGADGAATGTVTITDSRGAGAAGKTAKVRIPSGGSADIDGDLYVLDGAGQAVITFQATTRFTGDLEFEVYYASGEADAAKFTVRRGSA